MNSTQITSLINTIIGFRHVRYLLKLKWIGYLADTGSMKHEQDLFILP